MPSSVTHVTLATLAGGAALERFQEGLDRILANIQDPNTSPTKKRSLVLKVEFKPSKNRDAAEVEIDLVTKPANAEKFPTRIFIGHHHGQLVAVENDPKQQNLFDEAPKADPLAFPRAIDGTK